MSKRRGRASPAEPSGTHVRGRTRARARAQEHYRPSNNALKILRNFVIKKIITKICNKILKIYILRNFVIVLIREFFLLEDLRYICTPYIYVAVCVCVLYRCPDAYSCVHTSHEARRTVRYIYICARNISVPRITLTRHPCGYQVRHRSPSSTYMYTYI